MLGGATRIPFLALAVLSGCSGEQGKLEVRAAGTQLAQSRQPAAARLADANAQLALGNTGLALELFRKALREQPDSVEANLGIARSYERMRRFDLARRYLEAGLALEPGNTILLAELANSLQKQGKSAEAILVRQEIAERALMAEIMASAAADADLIAPQPVLASVPVPPAPGASITVALPPATAASAVPVPSAAPVKADVSPIAREAATRAAAAPKLERLSLAEVALVTAPKPKWQPQVTTKTASSTTIRFVPLVPKKSPAVGMALLNAARSQGLAAHTRDYLLERGWRGIAIGDATEVRDRSIIFYPRSRQRTAQTLAAQFRIPVAITPNGDRIVMHLGRDAARVMGRANS